MNRIKELREEQGISREELAKLLGISVEEYPKIEAIDARQFFDSDQFEKLAIRFGVPESYLNGKTNYLSKGERVYLGHVPDGYELRDGEHFYPINDDGGKDE